jgi:hypothetical protein
VTSVELKAVARAKIIRAREATKAIDKDLWQPIQHLQDVGNAGNGAGIYADIHRFRRALADAATAIIRAQKITDVTDWPTDHDYDIG